MKTIDKIPTGKITRAGKILKTGLKVGKNYAGYYGSKMIGKGDKDKLDEANAADIMESLQELKGGGLKVAQMLSMDQQVLPKAYVDQFSLAQYQVPPISAPLVKKTLRRYLGQNPEDVFDEFDYTASFAASIGQVHKARIGEQELAIKIQYPGVADSLQSDLAMLRPLASRLLGLNAVDTEEYFKEVESKLLEETDYEHELEMSQLITDRCEHIEGLIFPRYYPEYSSKRMITMDWIDALPLKEYLKTQPSQEERNQLGQRLWDFFMYQMHELRMIHADPHPGNILITEDRQIAVIDFGCIKEVPQDFYEPWSELIQPGAIDDEQWLRRILTDLDILRATDTPAEDRYFYEQFHEVLHLLMKPFTAGRWDFSDEEYFEQIATTGERLSRESLSSEYKMNRGSRHFIYVNRTFFGLYQLMHMMGAQIDVMYEIGETEMV